MEGTGDDGVQCVGGWMVVMGVGGGGGAGRG